LEFSFDRSKRSDSQSRPEGSAASSSENTQTDEVDTSTISNERLRKAIERNRARQKEREAQSGTQPRSSAWAQHQAHVASANQEKVEKVERTEKPEDVHVQSTLFEGSRAEREIPREMPREMPKAQERIHAENIDEEPRPKVVPPVATRRAPARPHDTEFTPVKRTPRKAASQVSYSTSSASSSRKSKPVDPNIINYLVKGSWIFCGFLILRLIFSQGGVIDYFSQRKTLNSRYEELAKIKSENMQLVHEIERMQLDASYQKKLVRDNLGFIAEDEYLILFPQEKSTL
jgi:cell division protein FtsB